MTTPLRLFSKSVRLIASIATALALAILPHPAQAQGIAVLHDFNGTDGAFVYGSPILGSDGKIYGTTSSTVFSVSVDGGNFTVLHTFSAATEGTNPQAGVVEGSDGLLYGVTSESGLHNGGTVFSLKKDGSNFQVLHTFNSGTGTKSAPNQGYAPVAPLIQASDGMLYGTTYSGGVNKSGTAFRMNTSGTTFTLLHNFSNSDGMNPSTPLLQGHDGALYGTTESAGPNGGGTLFKMNLDGTGFSLLYSFSGAANDGGQPDSSLLQGSDGQLYSMTTQGGTNDAGAIFKIGTDGSNFTLLHSFSGSLDASDGGFPWYGGLTPGLDGQLYGVASQGGVDGGYGAIFNISPDGSSFNFIHSFGSDDGADPYSTLVRDSNGTFYGTTYDGGENGFGTVFLLDVIPPVLTLPANITLNATGPSGAAPTFAATATDAVDGTDPVTYSLPDSSSTSSGSTFPLGTTTVTVTSTDKAGNSVTGSFTITVKDVPPVISAPAPIGLDANVLGGATVPFSASATDIVDGTDPVTFTYTDDSGNPVTVTTVSPGVYFFPVGTTTVTVNSTDANGNPATPVSFTVTVNDVPPGITASNIEVPANALGGAYLVDYSAALVATTDIVDGDGNPADTVTFDVPNSYLFPVGQTTVTATVTDLNGQTGSTTFTVTVDDVAPAVTVSAPNYTYEAASAAGASVDFADFSAATTDIVDGSNSDAVVYTLDDSTIITSPYVFSIDATTSGVTTVTATVTDANGQTGSTTFTVTVEDTTPPTITLTSPVSLTLNATGPSGAAETFSATATDLVDVTDPVTYNITNSDGSLGAAVSSGDTFAVGQTTVTVNSTDEHGNAATPVTFTITVKDVPPVITLQVDNDSGSGDANTLGGGQVTLDASAADIVDGTDNVTFTYTNAAGVTVTVAPGVYFFPVGTTTVTVNSTDANGNPAQPVTFTVSVNDVAPTITATNIEVPANALGGAYLADYSLSTITTTDIVDGDGNPADTVTFDVPNSYLFPVGQTTVTATVTDLNGQTGTTTFTVTVDDVAPTITVTAPGYDNASLGGTPNYDIEATSPAGAALNFSGAATDIVDGTDTVTYALSDGTPITSGYTFPIDLTPGGTVTTVTVSATDAAGDTGTTTFTVTVHDTTPPVITAPANQTLSTYGYGAAATFSATTSDLVDGATDSVSYNITNSDGSLGAAVSSGDTFPLGTTTVTVNSTDQHGNQATPVTFTITVNLLVVNVTLPPISTTTTADPDGTVSFPPTVNSGGHTYNVSYDNPGPFPVGTTTVTFTVTDSNGNVVQTGTFTVTIIDTTPPVITVVPANQILEATSPAGAVATFAATATDNVGVVSLTYSQASGSTFPLGVTTVTVTATDAAGNSSTATFTITVQDTTPPVITVPANQTIEATSASGAVATFAAATATDAVGVTSLTYSQASGTTFPLGTTIVTVTAKDAAGNTSTKTFTIKVQDTTPPVITVPANITVEATSPNGAKATFAATATDAVGPVTITYSKASGSTFPIGATTPGVTTVTVTATDGAGNKSTATFTVTVVDTTPPVITVPANLTLEATSPKGAVANFSTSSQGGDDDDNKNDKSSNGGSSGSATDIVDVTDPVTYSPASGSTFPLGTTTVTATSTDKHGNKSTKTFTVTVRDTTPPVITIVTSGNNTGDNDDNWNWNGGFGGSNQTIEATSASGAVATFSATATDNVGVTSLTYSKASGSTFPIGTTTVTVTAKDAAGNTATKTFTITVQDTTPPAITVPANITLVSTGPNGAVATFAATATDAVGVVSLTYSQASGTYFAAGTTTVTVTAKDAAGNTSTKTFTVKVTAPSGYKTFSCDDDNDRNDSDGFKSTLNNCFNQLYGKKGLVVGSGKYQCTFTNATTLCNQNWGNGGPGYFTGNYNNPTSTSAGRFGCQIACLHVAVDCSTAGISKSGFGSLHLCGTGTGADGLTVAQVLALADACVGGGSTSVSLNNLNNIIEQLCQSFDGSTTPSTWAATHLCN